MDKHINLLELYTSVVTDIEKHYPQLTKKIKVELNKRNIEKKQLILFQRKRNVSK